MDIEYSDEEAIYTFDDIDTGECFIYHKKLYMKIISLGYTSDSSNAIELSWGGREIFEREIIVIPVDAKIVVLSKNGGE